jgi:hypothetical protein
MADDFRRAAARNPALTMARHRGATASERREMKGVVATSLRLPAVDWMRLKHAALRESLRRGRPVPASELIREALAAHLAQMERAA